MFSFYLPLFLCFCFSSTYLKAQGAVPAPEMGQFEQISIPESLKIINDGGEIKGAPDGGIKFGGPVKVTGNQGLEIFSDRAELILENQSVVLEGNVVIYQGDIIQRGDRLVYFYETGMIHSDDFRVGMDPLFLEAGKFVGEFQNGRMVFVGKNAGITTHDVQAPGYWLKANQTKVYAGDKVTFKNLKIYAEGIPVFWLPYLSQPLDSELGYHFTPGTRSNWGPYLLNTYGLMLGNRGESRQSQEKAWLLSRWKMDLRSQRGVGLGFDLVDTRNVEKNKNQGLSIYYLNDLDPTISRTGSPRFALDEHRYHAKLQSSNLLNIGVSEKWRVESDLNYLSDRHYLEDYAPDLYQTDSAPDNILGIYRKGENTLFSVFGRFRINDFYRTDTQSPEIAFDQIRKPIFRLPILHEGQTSYSFRNERADDVTKERYLNPIFSLPSGDPKIFSLISQMNGYERSLVQRIQSLSVGDPKIALLKAQLLNTGFQRFHTNHSFSLPISIQNWGAFHPYLGAAYSRYNAVSGPSESDDRMLIHAGMEFSLKISKDLENRYDKLPGVRGLLHVLQPYSTWSNVAVDELESDYPKVDRLTFTTTRPRPLHVSHFTAIDEIEDWNILRLGVRNQLITRRDGSSMTWLSMDTYFDHFLTDPESDRELSNLYNDFNWNPVPWANCGMEFQIPLLDSNSEFSEINTYSTFMPSENTEFTISYRSLKSHPTLIDTNSIDLGTYLRLSENWGFGSKHRLELEDTTLEQQQYTFHRDIGNWVFGMGLTHRDNRFRKELGLVLSLTLKDFPSDSLPFGMNVR